MTLPVLEIDGIQLGNSIPIARFLARKYDLVGDNEIEMAQTDVVIDCLHDQLNGRLLLILSFQSNSLYITFLHLISKFILIFT